MNLSQALLATLAYHDIFNYPLTLEEIHKYLIQKNAPFDKIKKKIHLLHKSSKIAKKNGFYFLQNRSSLVTLRQKRKVYSQKKIKKAQLYGRILRAIPSLKLVGLTGALSMENSHPQDDIDFFFITSANTLWTTRLATHFLLLPFKRSPDDKNVSDKACLNIFIDESNLQILPRNLYTAHEICQMRPLWDREGIYNRFIDNNRWVFRLLPNWRPTNSPSKINNRGVSSQFPKIKNKDFPISALENFFKNLQLWYMRSRITTERVGDAQLFFHPQNVQPRVLKEYQKRLKALKIFAAKAKPL